MNKKQILAELIKNLEKYLEKGYVFHPKFMEEFQALLKNATGNEKEIFALLVKQLDFLKELGTNVYKADSNEIIKYQDRDYYSLHLSGKNFNLNLMSNPQKGIQSFDALMKLQEKIDSSQKNQK